MLKLILKLFLLVFVARSVTSIKCYVTNDKACGRITDKNKLVKCISDSYEKFTCESPKDKGCMNAHVVDNDSLSIDLRGCTSDKSAPKDVCEYELIGPIAGSGFPRSTRKQTKCEACGDDFCNENLAKTGSNVPFYKNVSYVSSYKNVSYYVIFFACLVIAIVLSF